MVELTQEIGGNFWDKIETKKLQRFGNFKWLVRTVT